MKKLENKVAIVTGSSNGIGAGIVKHLAAEGASVVVNYASNKEDADKVVEDIVSKGGKAIAVKADVTKQASIDHLFAETLSAFGKLDILVNNAGSGVSVPIENITEELFHRHFDFNVLSLVLASKKAVEYFGENGGNIINLSSMGSRNPHPNFSLYSATKAAIDAITKSLAKELGARRIRVNSLAPGPVDTPSSRAAGFIGSDMQKRTEGLTPLGRIGTPDDIGKVAAFLASDDAGWITGEVLFATGGL